MTAPIELYTGRPGAGKTAQLVARIVELREKEPGRPLFALGINGLKEGLAMALTMDQLHRWWELPPGSIVCIDECQEEHLFPKDRGNPPEWVQRLAKVRHHGMTFLLTTQDPRNMSAYVRRLVGRHIHTVNKFQSGMLQRFEWERCIDDTDSRTDRKQAVETIGPLPKEVFDLYKSSQIHTTKRRIPRKVYLFLALVVASVAALVAVPFVLRHAQQKNVALISGKTPAVSGAASSSGDADQQLRRTDVAKWMRPRVDGLPWTAPMFDQLQVQAQPRLYCVAVEDGRCSCLTEQGTRYAVPLDRCRAMVADGVYNPFVPPMQEERRQDQATRPVQPQAPAGSPGAAAVAGVDGSTGERATAHPYVPPTYAAWNADPFGSK